MDIRDIAASDQDSQKEEVPHLQWWTHLSIPIQAGDYTLHHGMTFHTAGSNRSKNSGLPK